MFYCSNCLTCYDISIASRCNIDVSGMDMVVVLPSRQFYLRNNLLSKEEITL